MKKMKKLFAAALISALCLSLMTGCSDKSDNASQTEQEETGADESEVGMDNPQEELTEEEMIETTGIDLPAPSGASNVVYSIISTDAYTIAQLDFTLDGIDFTERAITTSLTDLSFTDLTEMDETSDAEEILDAVLNLDTDSADISGLYYDWDAFAATTVSDRDALCYCTRDGIGYIAWLDIVPGILYNLNMYSDADTTTLPEYAERIFVPMQGED